MTAPNSILGIDISKGKFDVCLITAGGGKEKYRKFDNNSEGYIRLMEFLKSNGVEKLHACLEPTGRFGNKLALWLRENGHVVSIVNPYQIKGFAISELKRSKTDKLDAGIIARFCQMHNPRAWEPLLPDVEEIQQIGRYIDGLKQNIVQEKNRLAAEVENEFVITSIKNHIKFLKEQISVLEVRMRAVIKNNEQLAQAAQLLRSICGVGETTVFAFLGEIGLGEQFQATRQVEAYCGMNPQLRQSGNSVNRRQRLSKMGNVRMRKALYMPAVAALRHDPVVQKFYERLKVAGKHPKVIIGAIMRKLLRLMYALVRTKRPYISPINNQVLTACG